jgi:hypothetical protein
MTDHSEVSLPRSRLKRRLATDIFREMMFALKRPLAQNGVGRNQRAENTAKLGPTMIANKDRSISLIFDKFSILSDRG